YRRGRTATGFGSPSPWRSLGFLALRRPAPRRRRRGPLSPDALLPTTRTAAANQRAHLDLTDDQSMTSLSIWSGHREAERPHGPSSQVIREQSANAGCKSEKEWEHDQRPVFVDPAPDQIGGLVGRHHKWLGPRFPKHHGRGDVTGADHANANAMRGQHVAQRATVVQDRRFARTIAWCIGKRNEAGN